MGLEPHGVRVDPSPAQLPSPLRHRYRHSSCQRRRGPPRSRWRPLIINNRKRSQAFTGLAPSTRYINFFFFHPIHVNANDLKINRFFTFSSIPRVRGPFYFFIIMRFIYSKIRRIQRSVSYDNHWMSWWKMIN